MRLFSVKIGKELSFSEISKLHAPLTNLWPLITKMWLELGFSEYLMVFEATEVKNPQKRQQKWYLTELQYQSET